MPASDVGRERRAHQRQVRRCEVALALVREQTLFVENSLLDRQPMQFVTDLWLSGVLCTRSETVELSA